MGKIISELIEKTSASDSDVLLIENATSTNKITKANFLKEITQELSDNNQSVEGSYITVNGSKEGNITDIEIFGNTVQSSTNLADIQSVGELQEDGRYKMSILSCGKNLLDVDLMKDNCGINATGAIVSDSNRSMFNQIISVDSTRNLYLSNSKITNDEIYAIYYDSNMNYISNQRVLNKKLIIPNNTKYLMISLYKLGTANFENLKYTQLEEGTVATPYEPYQCNKSSILLPCQLEKIGDVSDRLFRREDGVWCVEKNIITHLCDGTELAYTGTSFASYKTMYIELDNILNVEATKVGVICDKLQGNTLNIIQQDNSIEGVAIHSSLKRIYFKLENSKATSVSAFKEYVKGFKLKYALATSQIIELPLDTQIALNSFNGVTNIFTEDTIIEPTIKATIPKSLGASVNSLVNKTDSLSKRLENVETLKEGSELEVISDKGYVVCENTNNGQIEGLKVEGKTLVNLIKYSNQTLNTTSWNNFIKKANLVVDLKTNTQYTVLVKIEGLASGKNIGLSSSNTYEMFESKSYTIYNNGLFAFLFSTKSDLSSVTDVIHTVHDPSLSIGTFTISLCVLEGDHTQNPPSYFEGLKSVGDGVDKIEVLSRKENGNLFDGALELGTYKDFDGEMADSSTRLINTNKFILVFSKTLYFDISPSNYFVGDIYCYDKHKKYLGVIAKGSTKNYCDLKEGTRFINFNIKRTDNTNVYVSDVVNLSISYLATNLNNPYTKHKKQILYQTKEGDYEKPILRSTGSVSDSIEKHSDGKYYFHKRCEEVVFDGSSDEGWNLYSANVFSMQLKSPYIGVGSVVVSNRYSDVPNVWDSSVNNNGAKIHSSGKLYIKELSQSTLDNFKTWLSQNPTTVVYQLETEEIYEVVNLDLDSYEGETSLIFDSGIISPKISFKIASHIANTVKVLKDRINYLEDKVMDMFKAVLAGNVQTLAYELYPEDFEKEIEEEIIEETETLEN